MGLVLGRNAAISNASLGILFVVHGWPPLRSCKFVPGLLEQKRPSPAVSGKPSHPWLFCPYLMVSGAYSFCLILSTSLKVVKIIINLFNFFLHDDFKPSQWPGKASTPIGRVWDPSRVLVQGAENSQRQGYSGGNRFFTKRKRT